MLSLFASATARSAKEASPVSSSVNQIKFERLLACVEKMIKTKTVKGLSVSDKAKLHAYWCTLVSLYVPGNEEYDTKMRFIMTFAKKEGCFEKASHQKPTTAERSSKNHKLVSSFGDKKGTSGFSLEEKGIVHDADHRLKYRLQQRLRQQLFSLRKQSSTSSKLDASDGKYITSSSSPPERMEQYKQLQMNNANARAELFGGLDRSSVDSLDDDMAAQEEMTEEIANMASSLKENVLRMQKVINSDKQVLDSVDDLIESHIPKVQQQTSRLEEHLKNSGVYAQYSMFFLVIMLFAYTYVVIRLTPRAYD